MKSGISAFDQCISARRGVVVWIMVNSKSPIWYCTSAIWYCPLCVQQQEADTSWCPRMSMQLLRNMPRSGAVMWAYWCHTKREHFETLTILKTYWAYIYWESAPSSKCLRGSVGLPTATFMWSLSSLTGNSSCTEVCYLHIACSTHHF